MTFLTFDIENAVNTHNSWVYISYCSESLHCRIPKLNNNVSVANKQTHE